MAQREQRKKKPNSRLNDFIVLGAKRSEVEDDVKSENDVTESKEKLKTETALTPRKSTWKQFQPKVKLNRLRGFTPKKSPKNSPRKMSAKILVKAKGLANSKYGYIFQLNF